SSIVPRPERDPGNEPVQRPRKYGGPVARLNTLEMQSSDRRYLAAYFRERSARSRRSDGDGSVIGQYCFRPDADGAYPSDHLGQIEQLLRILQGDLRHRRPTENVMG